MMHFYPGLTDEDCLEMPFNRLLSLYRVIAHIEMEDQLRQLIIVHSGEPDKVARKLEDAINRRSRKKKAATMPIETMVALMPMTGFEAKPGSIEEERARQRESAARIEAEWRAAKEAASQTSQ